MERRKITKWILKLCENFCERNLYNRIHHYERCHRNSSYKLSTLETVSNFQKINFNSILAISQKIVLDFTWKIVAKRCRRNSSLSTTVSRPGITGLDFSRAFGIPSLDTWRSAIGADTGIKGGKAGHLAPISLNRIFNPVPLSAVCRVVYCLTCTRPDCTIRGTLMHDKLAIYLPVHGFTCTRAPRNHLPATMELSYLDRSRG